MQRGETWEWQLRIAHTRHPPCTVQHTPASPPETSVVKEQPRVASAPVQASLEQGLMAWEEEATRVRPGEVTTSHS